MTNERPDPEALLRRVMAEEAKAGRGRLKVFLGYASRVGKTFRMVDEMVRRKSRGQDVVIGWIQDALEPEVRIRLDDLEVIPPRPGPALDVDAILARKPHICLVDELAHANPPGSRNGQRWQDVEELLAAGITVVTGINVQYVEGLQERVAEIIGQGKPDKVPDAFLRQADEVVLVDANHQELLARGARTLLTERQLAQMRELALLFAADTIEEHVEDFRQEHHIERVWGTQERLLVCVTAHGRGASLVERGHRAAQRLHGDLHVLYVTPDAEWSNLTAEQRTAVQTTLALARTFEAVVEVVEDTRPAHAILGYAQAHNITQIMLGHSPAKRFTWLLSRTTVGRIIRGAEGMDVHVLGDRAAEALATAQARGPAREMPPPAERPGHLRVYLGYAAGVGKTYQMLHVGNALRALGNDVVIGYFEPHDRAETIARVDGLETVPRRTVQYRGHTFEEMDLPAVLVRKPAYCLVDELAHTNVPGVEHEKRWRDVLTLLDAGIHVLTTVNIQHLESLNDLVFSITGVRVRETVPDWVLDQAEEVLLVDLTTRALRHRLERGVVYSREKAAQALTNFFREGNLESLRELALREVADTIEFGLERIEGTEARERVMICLSEHAAAATLVRRGKRMADRLRADCYAVYVAEDEALTGLAEEERSRIKQHLDLARTLNMHAEVLHGSNVADRLVDFAREHGVTQMFLGRTIHTGWREVILRNIIEKVIRRAPDMEIHVVADR